jgi:hypothetical protein
MNWKQCGRERPWPNLGHYPGIFLDGLRRTAKMSVSMAGLRGDVWTCC